jgi:glycosyltransferase involved in cell wall biosynthesis
MNEQERLPLVSIVTPSLSQGEFIEEAILSVLEQDYPRIEHIVVDGGSTDGTLDVLHRYQHLRWVSEPDGGQADALNKGFGMAHGEIYGWLNSDDLYLPGAISAAVEVMRTTECGLGTSTWSHSISVDNSTTRTSLLNQGRSSPATHSQRLEASMSHTDMRWIMSSSCESEPASQSAPSIVFLLPIGTTRGRRPWPSPMAS